MPLPVPASASPGARIRSLPIAVAILLLYALRALTPSPSLAQTPEQSLVSVFGGTPEYWTGFCKDTTPAGVAVSPQPRPRWSALASPHYDGGSRYPDYRNVSKNLAILQTLQFLLSVTTNLIAKVDDAQKQIAQVDLNLKDLDPSLGGLVASQSVGHCICANKPQCDPTKVLDTVDATISTLVDQQHVDQIFSDYLTQQVQATLTDLDGLEKYLESLSAPGGALDKELRLSLEITVKQQIAAAAGTMLPGPAAACDPKKIATYDADVATAVEEAEKVLRSQLDTDVKTVEDTITTAATLPQSTLEQIKKDIQELRTLFAGVHSVKDLARIDWAATKGKLSTMVAFYQKAAADVQAKAQALQSLWADLTKYPTLAGRVTGAIHDKLEQTPVAACIAAVDDPKSYLQLHQPADFTTAFKHAVQTLVQKQWLDAKAHVDTTLKSLQDRLAGAGAATTAVAVFDKELAQAAAAITAPVAECFGRDTRPACFKLCNAKGQSDFLWLPVDFLQDPKKAAAGVASAGMFALEQAGWLDQVSAWVQSKSGLQKDLGDRLGAAKMALSGIEKYLEQLQKTLGAGLAYVDRFTEGYHLGAYSKLRPDLHQCVPYAGHGVYAQLGGLGNDNFSLGARYTAHNLSVKNRLQFRSGGFAVSAFGHELSLAPTVEVTTQIDGFQLWNQQRPLGIPIGASLKVSDVKQLDVFNVVPMDKYPFGFSEKVPLGAAIVRDLVPSRRTPKDPPDWPRPGVTAPWESQSTAGASLGLNLGFDLGPERFNLAEIDVIPRILVAIPWFQISAGVNWTQQTNLFRDRIQEMVNVNLPASLRLADKDFQREMHAFQAWDLSSDDQTSVYVEPTLGVDAFLGFRLFRIDIGAGAGIGLAVNLRPGGQGGVLDLGTPLADAVLVSNPPANADCKPVWAFERKTSCSNKAFPDSKGTYACEALDGKKSCCIQATWPAGRGTFCFDDWTGFTESDCGKLNIPNATIPKVEAAVPAWKWLAGFKTNLNSLLDRAGQVQLSGTWNAATCEVTKCGFGRGIGLFGTAGLDISGISQCETFGRCTYPDKSVRQDMSLADCERGDDAYRSVGVTGEGGCALRVDGTVACWGLAGTPPPSGRFLALSTVENHACGVREDQTLVCWGQVPPEQATLPTGTFTAVAAGKSGSCAIRTSGEVACWGILGQGIPGGTFLQVDVDMIFNNRLACGVHPDGSVECWGQDWKAARKPFQGAYSLVRTLAGGVAICALRRSGGVDCFQTPGTTSSCDMKALLAIPPGPFRGIVLRGPCEICGLTTDGTIQCWGDKRLSPPPADVHLTALAGNQVSIGLCGLLQSGDIQCWDLFNRPPTRVASGSFSPYSCRSVTQESVKGWQGDGCHPLQQGFPSACACEVDGQCAAGEHCDAQKKSCTGAGGTTLSCLAAANGACPDGRISVGGACARPCQAKTDCAGSQVCEQERCVPPGHIPLAEEIVWGMARPQAPVHTISTYALSDFKATLLLKADIYVEASFKLFRKPRVWRLLDYHNAWDLGSTWKGWYAPGLEARYQHECENPRLDEPVTNRYPRPSTSNPFEAIFATHGIKDPSRNCGFLQGGGVCRYPQTLPAQQARPELYARGNSGTVSDLLRWCGDDLPRHVEDPAPSDNGQLSAGIADSAVWGKTVALDVWGRNRLCVNGVLWDDWLSALDGKGGGGAALEQTNCGYRSTTGPSISFPCKDATDAMLELWGCTLVDSSPFATELVKQFPSLAVTSPRTGTKMIDLGQVFGPGLPYTPESMAPQIRFASAGSGTAWVPRLGERWLEAVDQCFGTRFEDPAETVCRCTGDDDCNSAAGERCSGGRCEQPRTLDGAGTCLKPDCSPVYQARQCPVVFLDAAVGPCCGDGKVEKSARYSEECDAGPAGSATCTPDCKLLQCLPPPAGMAAWWPLDERSGRAAAERVRGWNGAWAGAPVPVAGKVDWALQFDGVHDSVEVADAPQLNMGTGDFSIDAWVQTSAQGTQPIVDKRTSGAVGYTLFLFDGRLGVQLGDRNLPTRCSADNSKSSCTNWIAPATMPSMADGKWHQVAVTVHRASGGGRLYADGAEVLAFDPTVRNQSLDNTAPLSIGRHHPNSSASQGFWRGLLDEVELFRRALRAEEVRALFNADRTGKCKPAATGASFVAAQ